MSNDSCIDESDLVNGLRHSLRIMSSTSASTNGNMNGNMTTTTTTNYAQVTDNELVDEREAQLLFQIEFDYTAKNNDELTVCEGDVVTLIKRSDDSGAADWWKVELNGKVGYVPVSYISSIVETTPTHGVDENLYADMPVVCGVENASCFIDERSENYSVPYSNGNDTTMKPLTSSDSLLPPYEIPISKGEEALMNYEDCNKNSFAGVSEETPTGVNVNNTTPRLHFHLPENEIFEVQLVDPKKCGLISKHINFKVITCTNLAHFYNMANLPSGTTATFETSRSYEDFVWLEEYLLATYPCMVVALPRKQHFVGNISGNFIFKRLLTLQKFCNRLTFHPAMRKEVMIAKFLELSDKEWKKIMKAHSHVKPMKYFKPQHRLDRSVTMESTRSYLTILEKNLIKIVKHIDTSAKMLIDLAVQNSSMYNSFFCNIAEHEPEGSYLHNASMTLAVTTSALASVTRIHKEKEVYIFKQEVKDVIRYIQAAIKMLQRVEDAQNHKIYYEEQLEKKLENREKITAKLEHRRTLSGNSKSRPVSGDFNDLHSFEPDLDEAKMHVSPTSSISRSDTKKIKKLESKLNKPIMTTNAFSDAVQHADSMKELYQEELLHFDSLKEYELRCSLIAFVETHQQFHKSLLSKWNHAFDAVMLPITDIHIFS